MAMQRRERASGSNGDWRSLTVESFVFDFPEVLEFVACSCWEVGVPRLTGTVLVMVDAGLWKLWAHDRDGSESLFCSGQSLEEAFRSLNTHLTQGSGEWRADKSGGGGKAKK